MSSVGMRRRHREKRRHAAKGRTPGGALFALITHTARMQFRSVIVWGLSLGLYSAAIVATFTTMDAGQMDRIADSLPEGMREAFSLTDLSTIEGLLDVRVFGFIFPLALTFFPILALSGAIAGAEERGTIDVLLGNPVRRWQLVVGNFVATAVSLLGILAISGLSTWATALLEDVDLTLGRTAGAFLNLWPFCLFFGGIAILCSAIFHRRSLAIAVPGFLLVGSYLIDVIAKVSEDLEGLRDYSIFSYYGSAIKDGIDWTDFGGITSCTFVLVLLTVFAFQRRDIYT